MITDIVLTIIILLLVGGSVILIPWVFFLIARAMLREANRKAVVIRD